MVQGQGPCALRHGGPAQRECEAQLTQSLAALRVCRHEGAWS